MNDEELMTYIKKYDRIVVKKISPWTLDEYEIMDSKEVQRLITEREEIFQFASFDDCVTWVMV